MIFDEQMTGDPTLAVSTPFVLTVLLPLLVWGIKPPLYAPALMNNSGDDDGDVDGGGGDGDDDGGDGADGGGDGGDGDDDGGDDDDDGDDGDDGDGDDDGDE